MNVTGNLRQFMKSGILFCLFICTTVLMGCATNPATKRAELMLVSEDKEFQIGKQVDKQVREEMGVYLESPPLRSAVKKLVTDLGRNSDRPEIIYRLEIIDSPDFNAFAVPGGFLYVHRGLLERANSLDELASVLGHEIAHVAARHSAAQISKAQLLNYGLFGLNVATGGSAQNYGSLINLGAALGFNKFSRDDEREADHFGTRYMVAAGYNPEASLDVMRQIENIKTREPSALDVWFMTHPPTNERLENLNREIELIRKQTPEALSRNIRRNQYIQLLDGLAVGQWNGKELIKGNRYYNIEFHLSIPIPDGWHAEINSKQHTAVFFDTTNDYVVLFNVEPLQSKKSSAEHFREMADRLGKKSLKRITPEREDAGRPHGAQAAVFEGMGRKEAIRAVLFAFVKGESGFSILGVTPQRKFDSARPQIDSMMQGLAFITRQEAAGIEPPRLGIHEVITGETWEKITRRYYGSSRGIKKLAGYNGLDPDINPAPGLLLKIPPSLSFR